MTFKTWHDPDAYCGECIHYRAGAGCTERGLSYVKFETSATFCDDFVDVDEVRE